MSSDRKKYASVLSSLDTLTLALDTLEQRHTARDISFSRNILTGVKLSENIQVA